MRRTRILRASRNGRSHIETLGYKNNMTNDKCWICGNLADTAEHTVKKSDLIRMSGSKIFGKHNRLVKHTADKRVIIQGPNSRYIKYEKSLCKRCNNETTQPHDLAYDIFICHIIEYNNDILNTKIIKFNKIFNYNTKKQQLNLFKYFVKSFGCQLIENNISAPTNLVDFLNGNNKHNLHLAFSIRDDIEKNEKSFFEFYQVHNLEKLEDKDTVKILKYMWAETIGWLRISYWYNCIPESFVGSTWQGRSKKIVLGRCE